MFTVTTHTRYVGGLMLRPFLLFMVAATTLLAAPIPQPTVFVENTGQWPARVLYGATTADMMVWITTTGMILDQRAPGASGTQEHHEVTLDVIGASGSRVVRTQRAADAPMVYFSRNNAQQQRTPTTVTSVVVRNVRPGIHLEYVWDGPSVRYNVLVDAGVSLPTPLFSVAGAEEFSATSDGFTCRTSLGSMSMSSLAAFSTLPRHSRSVAPIARGSEIGFAVQGRKGGEALTIDPIVSAYAIHGAGTQEVTSMGIDKKGNVVVAGWTSSFDIVAPTNGASPSGAAGIDGFIACFDAGLTKLLAWTYIAGDSNEVVRSLAMSPLGDIWVTGETNSTNIPVSVPKGGKYSGSTDGFVLRYASDLSHVLAGMYISGNAEDRPLGIACNLQGNALICGQTNSATGFPPVAGFRRTPYGKWDGFVMSINRTGVDVETFTYVGGVSDDALTTIASDSNNNMVAAGWTSSNDVETFPMKTLVWIPDDSRCDGGYWAETGSNAFDVDYNGGTTDVLVTKYASDGALIFTSYFGGSGEDRAKRILTYNDGRVMIVGTTRSKDMPVTTSEDTYGGKADVFATAVSGDGTRIRTSVYFGGEGDDEAGDATWDPMGNPIITGTTTSSTLPIVGAGASAESKGRTDGFLSIISATEVLFSTTFGWTGDDMPRAVARNADGDCIIAGTTTSSFGGNTVGVGTDGFVLKWAFGTLVVRTPIVGTSFCVGTNASITWISDGIEKAATFNVDFSADAGQTWTNMSSGLKVTSYTAPVPAQAATTGTILFRVSSSHGHVTASPASYTVKPQTLISTQPTSVSVDSGATVTLQTEATGEGVTYQWQFNGVNIAGATSATLEMTNVSKAQQGAYRCVIGSACGSVTSAIATVTVKDVITVSVTSDENALRSTAITPQPASDVIRVSLIAPLSVAASVIVRSMSGVEVARGSIATATSSVELSVASLPTGAYTVMIMNGSTITHRMLMIQR